MGCTSSLPDSDVMTVSSTIICTPDTDFKDTIIADIVESKSGVVKQVNDYIFLKSIGHGSFANVFLVQSKITQLFFACKLFSKAALKKRKLLGRGMSSDHYETVKKEIIIMKLLKHKNIVELVEVIDDPNVDQLFLIIEYIKSPNSIAFSPKSLLRSSTNISSQHSNLDLNNLDISSAMPIIHREIECRSYFNQLIDGVMYMHSLKICHRDIKPENILFGEHSLKICDFGASMQFEGDNDLIRETVGSAAFMAPEMCVASNDSFSARKTDIWACGVTLFVLLFDYCPFMAQTVPAIYLAIVNQPLEIPLFTYPRHYKEVLSGNQINEDDDRCSRTSPELFDLINGIMHKDPSRRFSLETIKSHPWMNK